jgi:hypothetical protein
MAADDQLEKFLETLTLTDAVYKQLRVPIGEEPRAFSHHARAICPWCEYHHYESDKWVTHTPTAVRCYDCDNMFTVCKDTENIYRTWVTGHEKP